MIPSNLTQQPTTQAQVAPSQVLTPGQIAQVSAAAQVAAQTHAQNGAIIDLSGGEMTSLGRKPTSTLVTALGRNAADDANAAVEVYAFNTDIYNKTVLDGTTTAAKPETYNDGFTGKNINRYLQVATGLGTGLVADKITFVAYDAAGNQDLTILEAAELAFIAYNGVGGKPITKTIDLGEALRNTAFQSGMLTIRPGVVMNSLTQMYFKVPAGCKVTANVSWK